MSWVLLVMAAVGFVELLLRLPFRTTVNELQQLLTKVSRVLRSSSMSDHWKEKAMLAYARQLFMLSLKLFVILVVSLLPAICVVLVGHMATIDVLGTLTSYAGIALATIVALIYLKIRSALV